MKSGVPWKMVVAILTASLDGTGCKNLVRKKFFRSKTKRGEKMKKSVATLQKKSSDKKFKEIAGKSGRLDHVRDRRRKTKKIFQNFFFFLKKNFFLKKFFF